MRNGYLTAIAPTSSTSIIAGTTAGVDPVMNRFFLDENQCLTFRATKATKDEMRQAASIVTSIPCPVSPFYQLLANTPDATADSPDTACVPELSDFIVDVQPIVLSHYHNGLPTMGLQFQPRSRATLISYDAP